ncbi:response regulator [Sphingorhabdus sp. M41]|uniref:response regulator n=1 Tax=Sphingorhabdus sp. M41 TaxID=1806885 RepID=UPI00078E0699|nr:response regulator [Sphingorhabdus sp. M41]AMO72165.1 hypothetical protein AZE99_10155 [Sphingorhabdus sp. M41]
MKQNQGMNRANAQAQLQCQNNASNSSTAKARLLLVEDHDVNQILIQAMTKRLGYETELASDGTEAVAQISQSISNDKPFDLVLMDIQMPFMDGYEATRIIRTSGISEEILPIIAITANAYGDDIRNCLEAGMQAHIAKPVDISILESVLKHWIKPKQPDDNSSAAKEAKSELSEDLVKRFRLRKEETISAVIGLVRKGTFSEGEIRKIQDELHKLAGTAAMFGEAELGEQAKLLEDGLSEWQIEEFPQKMQNALHDFLKAA